MTRTKDQPLGTLIVISGTEDRVSRRYTDGTDSVIGQPGVCLRNLEQSLKKGMVTGVMGVDRLLRTEKRSLHLFKRRSW